MSSRDRKNAARRKRLKKQQRGASVASAESLPRPLRLVAETVRHMYGYAEKADNVQEAATLARDRVISTARQLAELTAPYDAFDVLELVRMANTMANPETYKETEHEGRVSTIEVVAAVLAARGARTPVPATDELRPRPDQIMDEVLRLANELVDAGAMVALFTTMAEPDALAQIGLGAVLREIHVRNLAYPHMVEDTLKALFDGPIVSQHLHRLLGFDCADARSVFAALQELHETAWAQRFEALDGVLKLWKETTTGAVTFTDQRREHGRALWDSVWQRPGDCSTPSDQEVATAAQRTSDVVRRVRDAFSTYMTPATPEDAALTFLEGASTFRTRPLVADPGGDTATVHGGLLTPAIRERLEEALKTDNAAWATYDSHRAKYLESAALDLLARHLPGAKRHDSIEYFVPASPAELAPAAYTKLVEGDGLLIVDDIAIAVEGKAGALRPASRSGNRVKLQRDLRGLVTSASEQADRVRMRILGDGGLRSRDGSWLDLSGIREVHTIAVTLDDLSGIATITSNLVVAGLLPGPHLPWTVSLHDLRTISELVDRPSDLLLYLRRRTEPDVTRRFHAVDELDFYLHFLDAGLWVEPDPDRVAQLMPHLPAPGVAARRRYAKQGLSILTSRTDALDAWYLYKLGHRTTPATKPTANVNSALVALVDDVAALGQPGWLPLGTHLREGDSATQRKWAGYAHMVCTLSVEDGRRHTMMVHGGSRPDNTFIVVWASRPKTESVEHAQKLLLTYVMAKKHQTRAARAFGLLFDAPTEQLVATVVDNRLPAEDPELDALVENLQLRPLDAASSTAPPPPPRRGRRPKKSRKR